LGHESLFWGWSIGPNQPRIDWANWPTACQMGVCYLFIFQMEYSSWLAYPLLMTICY